MLLIVQVTKSQFLIIYLGIELGGCWTSSYDRNEKFNAQFNYTHNYCNIKLKHGVTVAILSLENWSTYSFSYDNSVLGPDTFMCK